MQITQDLMAMLRSWGHSGFQVCAGPRILPREEEAMEKLTHYIILASFSQERMTYLPEESKVVYGSKTCPHYECLTQISFQVVLDVPSVTCWCSPSVHGIGIFSVRSGKKQNSSFLTGPAFRIRETVSKTLWQ